MVPLPKYSVKITGTNEDEMLHGKGCFEDARERLPRRKMYQLRDKLNMLFGQDERY
jgi:hypothetical protein